MCRGVGNRVDNGVWSTEVVRETDTEVVTKDAPVRWTFTPKEGGSHRLQFTVTDTGPGIAAEHLPLQCLQLVDLAFHRARAPRFGHCRPHGSTIVLQPMREGGQLGAVVPR